MHFDYIIIGAGLPSLLLAKYMTATMKKSVAIIDSSANIGGLYYPVEHNKEYYDDAMHVVYTTGVSEIDEIIEDYAHKLGWIRLAGCSKDLAGSSYNGIINESSPYIDLRSVLSPDFIEAIKAELSHRKDSTSPFVNGSVSEGIYFHFGKSLGNVVHSIISDKFGDSFLNSASDALRFNDLRRVIIDGYSSNDYLALTSPERAVFGFPDQGSLPPNLINSQVGFYPKDFTWKTSLEYINKNLKECGVVFILKANIESIMQNGGIFNLSVKEGSNLKSVTAGFVVSTIGPGIERYFDNREPDIKPESAILTNKTTVKYYKIIDNDNSYKKYKNYYYFDYNKSIDTYRVTFYRNYSSWLDEMNINILSQEIWHSAYEEEAKSGVCNSVNDLSRMGFDFDQKLLKPIFSVNKIRPSFPKYDLLIQRIEKLRQIEKRVGNIACAGVMSSRDSLLLPGVLRNLFAYFI
jgi:protoporphyrinogen oxidase